MMPKSTATILPSASTNRLPGCMSAWKKPSRSAWRRKDWISVAAELRQVEARPRSAARSDIGDAVDPFHRQHVAAGALPVDGRHAEIRIVLGVLRHLGERGGFQPQIHLDRDRARQRRRHLDQAQPPRLGGEALPHARGEGKGVQIALEAALDAGPQHLDRDRLAARRASSTSRAMHLRDRGGGDGRAEARQTPRATACSKRARSAASASACGNGGMRSCRLSRSRATSTPTTSGRVARNWPSLT